MHLLEVPTELLATICGHLGWEDMLMVRRTCKSLKKLSYTRDVWAAILSRYIGDGRIPRPFVLPKPLPDCSSHDLERAIKASELPWPKIAPTASREFKIETSKLDEKRILSLKRDVRIHMRLLPGGRWLLVGSPDGSVSYLDLRGLLPLPKKRAPPQLPLKPLIPPAYHPQHFVSTRWDFDIDTTLSSTRDTRYYITEFNVAIVVSYRPLNPHQDTRTTSRMTIWRVFATSESLKAEKCYTFEDQVMGSRGWGSISLMGDYVAYDRQFENSAHFESQCIVVLHWSSPAEDRARRVLHILEREAEILGILLLPGGRLMVSFGTGVMPFEQIRPNVMHLYDWQRDSVRDGSPPNARVSDRIQPLWVSKQVEYPKFYWNLAFRYPWFMPDGEVRLVARCSGGIYGFRIFPRSTDSAEPVHAKCLLKEEVPRLYKTEIPFYDHVISLQRRDAFSRRWETEGPRISRGPRSSAIRVQDPSVLQHPRIDEPIQVLYDPFAHRFVYSLHSEDVRIRVLDLLVF